MALSVGDFLENKYRILKHLGRGSRGDVYLARHKGLNREVAVKHLRPGSVREQADVEHFLAEARTIAGILDENVVTIYDVITGDDENYYLVLEYANEGTVASLLRREGRLPVIQALELCLDATRSLEVVHAEGILHGDIKPSNILLVRTREGIKAKLADFGLSQMMPEGETDQAAYPGSVLYASPERLQNKSVDHRADLYALGAVLYEMLTGQPLFTDAEKPEDMGQVIQGHLESLPLPPSQLNPAVSPAVDELILKALNKAPDDRYPDAQTMGQALRQAIETHRTWQAQVEMAYNQAVEHEQRREWDKAVVAYEAVLKEQPANIEARERMEQAKETRYWKTRYRGGLQAYDQGAWAEAQQILLEIVNHDEGYAGGDAATKLAEAMRQRELDEWY
jgi:serine/threonine protein kinase